MSEEMQPIDPVTAAMLMGQIPDPCEPTIEISHKVLTRLMDVVEFGDQLERVEKDHLLAHLKDVLAADQPELWAMYIPGPGEVHPMISKEEAERQISELLALFKERLPTTPITINVIPSPFSPLEHFELLAEETIQHRNDLLEYVKELEDAAKHKATVLVAQENLHLQAVNCPHSINEHEVVLRFDPTQPGHNALNQLARRLSAALRPAELDGNSTTVAMPAGLHPDTQDLVTRFATALAVKLHAAELKHGYSDGWKEPHWMDECRQKLIEHLAKGDPRDVAAYCAFLWHHCQSTSPAVPDGYAVVPKRMELLPEDIAVIMYHCGGDPDATEVDEQFTGGILWIGEVQEDDGSLVHGLNIASAECPEEGSTTLVELAAAPSPAKAVQQEQL